VIGAKKKKQAPGIPESFGGWLQKRRGDKIETKTGNQRAEREEGPTGGTKAENLGGGEVL